MLKRLFDIVFSFLGLIFLSPLILIIAILIKRESPEGPVFYRGERIGKGGKPFKMFKFRTMIPDAEKYNIYSTAIDDKRLLKVGRFLKKYQLDEIPQLLNVLRGEMSLVGPRPEVKKYVDMMTQKEKEVILSVRPGMTDLASLWNFHEGEILKGSTDPDRIYQKKIWPEKKSLQIKYVEEKSFWLDLKIILKTIFKIFQ